MFLITLGVLSSANFLMGNYLTAAALSVLMTVSMLGDNFDDE